MSGRLYTRWLDDLWNGELSELRSIARRVVVDDFTGHWPGRPGHVRGPDQLAAQIREGRDMFDDLAFEVEVGPVADGNLIAARWVGRGRYEGTPTVFHGHDILRHDGERFLEYWVIAEMPQTVGEG